MKEEPTMSDRTYLQVVVYDCPEAERAAALAAIRETVGDPSNEAPDGDALVLGERYGDDGAIGDSSGDVAAAIIDAAPGSTFATWTDPAYDWLGLLVMYAPDRGRFSAECDANGNAMVAPHEVRRMMAESLLDTEPRYGGRWPDAALREALSEAFGLDWSDAIGAAQARIEDRAYPAPEGFEYVRCPLGSDCTIDVDAGTDDATPGGQSAAQLAQGRHFHGATPIEAAIA
jgi:hypothetical protein